MKCRLLVALLCGIGCTSATAQVTSRFYLEKTVFAKGEPVFLYLDLVNEGSGPAEIDIGDPDQPFCSGVSIAISNDAVPGSSCPLPRDAMCVMNGQVDMKELQSGHTDTLRFLLNFRHEINAPGDYRVSAKFVGFAVYHVPAAVEKTEAGLEFRVETNPIDSGEWKPWVEQLRSPASEKRQEAAKTLASLAPPSLENTLLGFADDPEFRRYAPLALHRLNTPRSTEALAQMFMNEPLSNEGSEAAGYLAATHDRKWYPLLRDAAEKNTRDNSYLSYAAELGGEEMLPLLVRLEKGSDTFANLTGIMAMGSTGTRAVIPILLDELQNPDTNVRDQANGALQELTHRTPFRGSPSQNGRDEYFRWPRWWEREGATAPIYTASECGPLVPLP